MMLKEKIMKFQTYKMFAGEDTVYVKRDDILNLLEKEPQWIPTSERYPKTEDEYKFFLVTDDKGKVSVQKFYLLFDEEPQPYFTGMTNVVAWMPLPKPYREVEE